ncbi:Had-like domain, partial [Globisporangium splendens]
MLMRGMMTTAARMAPRHRVVLCADFDQTLTVNDTIALLFQSAAMRQPTALAREQHAAQVQQLVKQYASETSAFLAEKNSLDRMKKDESVQHRSDQLRQRFDREGLRVFLEGYARVDMASIQRVVDSRLLQGIQQEDLVENAARIELMDGCLEVLESVNRIGAAFVISSNWSIQMLHTALHSGPEVSREAIVKVIANDLEMDTEGVTTGKIDLCVQSPQDKADWIQRARLEAHTSEDAGKDDPCVVFVGDSANDLLAIVEADVGISLAVGGDASVYEVANQFGATFKAIGTETTATLADCATLVQDARSKGQQVIFTANDWHEIRKLLS